MGFWVIGGGITFNSVIQSCLTFSHTNNKFMLLSAVKTVNRISSKSNCIDV